MSDAVLSRHDPYEKYHVLPLPAGYLGLHFSNSVPCEIKCIDDESPIFDSTVQCLGRLAFHLSIPNKVDIGGALDNATVESILTEYSNIPDRKLIFKNRCEKSRQWLVTTTVLPTGPIDASFRSSRGLFKSRNRVCIENAPSNKSFEFPTGHFVKKVIIPNQFELEGGIQTPKKLLQILNHFSEIPGRKIVFQKDFPRGGVCTRVTLPKGPTGLFFYSALNNTSGFPVVSLVLVASSAWRMNVPVKHLVKKLIIPNEITVERMGHVTVERLLNEYSEVDDRVIVLQEFRRDIPAGGSKITLTLPIGELGIIFSSHDRDGIWIRKINPTSQLLYKVPPGYYIESLVIPGELELIGIEEMICASYLTNKLEESSHIPHRILVLQQHKRDVKKRCSGTRFQRELV